MSHRTPSSATHVGFPTVTEQDEYEDKSDASWTVPSAPLRAVNPTVVSSDSPRGSIVSPRPTAIDPRMSSHLQHWSSMVEGGPPPEFVDMQPTGMETMSIGRFTTSATLETFPYDRAPNLQKLTRVYYRLYTKTGGAYPSKYPEHADDPSLSHIYAEHVPPPRLANHYLLHVCAREGVHTSRVQLYLRSDLGPVLRPAVQDEVVQILPPQMEQETLHFNIDMPNEADRNVAADSIGVCTLGGRAIGKCAGACCSGSTTAFVSLCQTILRLPEGIANSAQYCCLNFRNTWIACWTCGNSEHYHSTSDRECHCLLCPCCWCCDC